eukprot:1147501-Pelagomonas_calceolata.AAC.3
MALHMHHLAGIIPALTNRQKQRRHLCAGVSPSEYARQLRKSSKYAKGHCASHANGHTQPLSHFILREQRHMHALIAQLSGRSLHFTILATYK